MMYWMNEADTSTVWQIFKMHYWIYCSDKYMKNRTWSQFLYNHKPTSQTRNWDKLRRLHVTVSIWLDVMLAWHFLSLLNHTKHSNEHMALDLIFVLYFSGCTRFGKRLRYTQKRYISELIAWMKNIAAWKWPK